MDKYKTIEILQSSGIATIWLNRPEVHNAISPEMIAELHNAFRILEQDENILLILLRGRGNSFSSGADLNSMKKMSTKSFEINLKDAEKLAELLFTIYSFSKPIISVLHGFVAGGANGIAAASDIVIADAETLFKFSEVRLGLSPATIAPYVLRKIGFSAANDLMITARTFHASEAKEISLVNYVFQKQELEEGLKGVSEDILHASPNAIKETRKLLGEIFSKEIDKELITFTAWKLASVRSSEEGNEGLTAFLQKRDPNWLKLKSGKIQNK